MLALHHSWEPDEEPGSSAVADARARVARLEAGLPRALLSTHPTELRRIALAAARAEAAVARWQARVGERPALDPMADAGVVAAVAAVTAARADQNAALYERHKLLAIGNGIGILALGAAAGLISLGVAPMALPVAATVMSAAAGPLTAGWLATQRCSIAARNVGTARSQWASALEATGLSSMGELSARRVAIAAWERRCREAAAAVEAARPYQRPWYRLAGPGVSPREVEDVIARIEELRAAMLHLLAALLEERVEAGAMAVLAPAAEVAAPESSPSSLDDALSRLRGTKLRIWPS